MDQRLEFQLRYASGWTVNVGCEANPAGFGTTRYPRAINVDLDRWSGIPNFVQADGAQLPFGDGTFDTAVLGDMLEHCADPRAVLREACRVAAFRIVITLPTDGRPEPEGREIHHVEALRRRGLKELGPGAITLKHAHRGEHGYTEEKVRALVHEPLSAAGFKYWIVDTGATGSPAIGCVASRNGMVYWSGRP